MKNFLLIELILVKTRHRILSDKNVTLGAFTSWKELMNHTCTQPGCSNHNHLVGEEQVFLLALIIWLCQKLLASNFFAPMEFYKPIVLFILTKIWKSYLLMLFSCLLVARKWIPRKRETSSYCGRFMRFSRGALAKKRPNCALDRAIPAPVNYPGQCIVCLSTFSKFIS